MGESCFHETDNRLGLLQYTMRNQTLCFRRGEVKGAGRCWNKSGHVGKISQPHRRPYLYRPSQQFSVVLAKKIDWITSEYKIVVYRFVSKPNKSTVAATLPRGAPLPV